MRKAAKAVKIDRAARIAHWHSEMHRAIRLGDAREAYTAAVIQCRMLAELHDVECLNDVPDVLEKVNA